MTTRLFGRSWYARIGGVEITDLDIEFSVFKSIKREPNKCTLKVYGLSEETRRQIESGANEGSNRIVGRPWIELKAGYGDSPSTLFLGQTNQQGIVTEANGTDVVITLEAKDGGESYQRSRINQSFAAGTRVEDVLRAAVSALGIGEGNLSDFTRNLQLTNGTTEFVDGYTASGPARDVVNNIILGAGLRWAIQNGVLSIRYRGRPIQNQAVLITPDTGLIGSPTVDPKGIVTATCLIQTGLEPGRKIHLRSRQFDGGYQVRSVTYSGNTVGDDWSATCELAHY